MNSIFRSTLLTLCVIVAGGQAASAAEVSAENPSLQLTPGLMELLREEMRALLVGVQTLPAGIATADWRSVAATSGKIGASYIMSQKLTPTQREELEKSLPAYFKRLDADFHQQAARLQAAALNHDGQLASFHYYRLIEACTVCHAAYALEKFPGFAPAEAHGHGH